MSARAALPGVVACLLAAALGVTPSTALAASDPTVVAGHKVGPVALSGRSVLGTVGSLRLAAGSWAVSAKLDVVAVSPNARRADCRLVAGGDYDNATATLHGSVAGLGRSSLQLLVTHSFPSAGTVQLRCSNNGESGDVNALFVRIIATRAGRLERSDLSTSHGPTIVGSGTPRIVSGWLNGPVATTTISGTTTALPLAAGNWSIQAKAVVTSTPAAQPDTQVSCTIRAGGDFDTTSEGDLPAGSIATLALEVVHHFAASDPNPKATLTCVGSNVTVRQVKITALKAGTLTNQPLPGSGASPVGTGSPVVRAGYLDNGYLQFGGGAYSTFASLQVPAGNWAVTAKISAFADIAQLAPIRCELASGTLYDRSRVDLEDYTVPPGHRLASMAFALTRTISAPAGGAFLIRCADEGRSNDAIELMRIKIVAVKAGSLSDTGL